MKIHREGYLILAIGYALLIGLQVANYFLWKSHDILWIYILLTLGIVTLFYILTQFFRIPKIDFKAGLNDIMSPADGKVVVVEEVMDDEYFTDKRIQVSIFMSIWDVHCNFNPISGIIKYVKYHPGKFLIARNPKSSTDNERSSIVTQHENGQEILQKQIAGAVARRICYYVEEGEKVEAGKEYGFIKFGSRIDLLLPIGTKIDVKIGDKVKGRVTKIGTLQ